MKHDELPLSGLIGAGELIWCFQSYANYSVRGLHGEDLNGWGSLLDEIISTEIPGFSARRIFEK